MAQPVLTKAFLQLAKIAAMCTAHRDYDCSSSPIPLYLVVKNLSSKWIVLWSKLHDGHTRHQ